MELSKSKPKMRERVRGGEMNQTEARDRRRGRGGGKKLFNFLPIRSKWFSKRRVVIEKETTSVEV